MKKITSVALATTLIISSTSFSTLDTNLISKNNIVFAAENKNNKNSTENDKPKADVKLSVKADQTINLNDGRSATINVKVNNNSPSDANNVTAQAIIENPDKVYIDGNGYLFEGEEIRKNSSQNGSFKISTEDSFESKTVPVKIILRYYNEDNIFQEQEETIYIRVIAPEKQVNPSIEIVKMDRMWPKTIETGQVFPASFEVKNTGDNVAKNIKVSLEGLENNNITLSDGLSTRDITRLEPGQSQYIYYNLKTGHSTKPGSYMLKLDYKFTGEKETSAPIDGNYQFGVDIIKSKVKPSTIEFSNITFPTKPIGRNQSVNISFDITNTGKFTANDVKVMANSENQEGLASKSVSQINTTPLKAGESRRFTFTFITTPSAETRNYPVELKVSYTDKNTTDEPYTANQIAGVFVQAPKESTGGDAEKGETSVPKLIIEEYSFDPEIIEAGKPFNMRLKLYNTSANKAVKNIKIFLTSDVQESVGQGGENQEQTGSGSSSASVFTPVDSSNTFYIASIAPGSKVEKEIKLTTVPDTAAKTYTVIANFEYEDAKAQKYTANEQIGVPVVQRAKLDVGEILPEGNFSLGMETPLSVDFFNTGKATLYNVMVKINGDGLKFDTPTYYKGNFQPGASDNFSCNITPESGGKKRFTLTFSFEDSTGQNQSVIRDYEFSVDDDMPIDDDMPMEEPSNFSFKKIFKIILGLLLIAGIGFLGKKFYDKKKDDKEDLDL